MSPNIHNHWWQQWSLCVCVSVCRPTHGPCRTKTERGHQYVWSWSCLEASITDDRGGRWLCDGADHANTTDQGLCQKPLLYGVKEKSGVGGRVIGYSFDERSCYGEWVIQIGRNARNISTVAQTTKECESVIMLWCLYFMKHDLTKESHNENI